MQAVSFNNIYQRVGDWYSRGEDDGDPLQSVWRFWRMGSIPVGVVKGVDIRIHVLALSGVFLHFAPLQFLALILALLMHEAGHAVAARLNACDVRGIVLLPPVGAVTIGEVDPADKPFGSLIVAVAGPLVNLLVSYSIMHVGKGLGLIQSYGMYKFLNDLAEISKLIGFVNLLPLWPLDGGRIVHSALRTLKIEARKTGILTFALSAIVFVGALWWSWSHRNYWDMGILCLFITASYWNFMKIE